SGGVSQAREELFYDGSGTIDACGTSFRACKGALTKRRVYRNAQVAPGTTSGRTHETVGVDDGVWDDGAAGNPIRHATAEAMRQSGGDPVSALAATVDFGGPYGLFPTVTMNQLGHRVEATFDLGTGAVLTERGPNSKRVACDLCRCIEGEV